MTTPTPIATFEAILAAMENNPQPQVIRQTVQVQGLLTHGVERGGVGLQQSVLQRLDVCLDVGQRRPQFAGDIRHHGATLALRLFQGIGYGVEGPPQFGDFVVAPRFSATRQVAVARGPDRGGEIAAGAQHPPGEQQHQQDARRAGYGAEPDERLPDGLREQG